MRQRLASACAALLLGSCAAGPTMVDAVNLQPATDVVVDYYTRFLDGNPDNDPVPADEDERLLWLQTGADLKRTVDEAVARGSAH